MPKKKTNKSAAKRFRVTPKGKVTYAKAGAGHLMSAKSRKRKRDLRSRGILSPAENRRVAEMLSS